MIDYIFEMSLTSRVIWITLLITGNILAILLTNSLINKSFKKNSSITDAVNRYRLMKTYILVPYSIVIITFSIFLILPVFIYMGLLGEILSILIVIFINFILGFLERLLLSSTINKLRSISMKKKELIVNFLKSSLVLYAPYILIVVGILTIISLNMNITLKIPLTIGYTVFTLLLCSYILKSLNPVLSNTTPMEDDLKEAIDKMAQSLGFSNIKIYNWKTTKGKVANAFVYGIRRYSIYISDYYINNSTKEEVLSVVAHELGHVKLKHSQKRLFFAMLGFLLLCITVFWVEEFKYWYEDETKVLIYALELIIYYAFILKSIFRSQEKEADEFVLEMGFSPETYSKALVKLYTLNNLSSKMNNLDEKFQTHPSLRKRLSHINEAAQK